MTVDNQKVISFYAKRLKKSKWQVMLIAENGIQIKKVKQVNSLGVWCGLFLLPFWGIGFIVWILTILDYALQQEHIRFVTVDQMIEQLKAAK